MATFIKLLGIYFFKRLPFAIASALENFQNRIATEVSEGLEGVVCRINVILIWTYTQEHDSRLHALLRKLEKVGITQYGKI